MNTLIKLFPKFCSCCKKLGEIQYDYENEIDKLKIDEEWKDKPLSEIQLEVNKRFNLTKMCCLNNTENAATYFHVDTYFNQICAENLGSTTKNLNSKNGPNTLFSKEPPSLPF